MIDSFGRAACRNSLKSRAAAIVERKLNEQVQTLLEWVVTQLMQIQAVWYLSRMLVVDNVFWMVPTYFNNFLIINNQTQKMKPFPGYLPKYNVEPIAQPVQVSHVPPSQTLMQDQQQLQLPAEQSPS